jgi:poly(3-hydroxybutyrate) depolymerase
MTQATRRLRSPWLLVLLASACGGTETAVDAGAPGRDAGPGPGTDAGADAGIISPVEYSGTFSDAAGFSSPVLTVAGLERDVELYVPAGLGASPALLVALHGTYGNGPEMVGPGRPQGFEDVADAEGVVLVAPSARQLEAGDWDQHGDGEVGRSYWETLPRDDPSRGADPDRNPDLLLVRAIIAEAERALGVDPRRVYVAGHSNGGFFALHVAVVLRDQIAAFAESASGMVRCDDTSDCQFMGDGTTCAALALEAGFCACTGAEKPVPLPTSGRMPPGYLSHSNDDGTVSVAYSCDLAARMEALGHEVSVAIGDHNGGHSIAGDFPANAWAFFATRTLP